MSRWYNCAECRQRFKRPYRDDPPFVRVDGHITYGWRQPHYCDDCLKKRRQ